MKKCAKCGKDAVGWIAFCGAYYHLKCFEKMFDDCNVNNNDNKKILKEVKNVSRTKRMV